MTTYGHALAATTVPLRVYRRADMCRRVRAVLLGAAVAAGAAVFACRQIAGIQEDPVGTPTGACGLPYGTNACADCVANNCCSESNACAMDPDPASVSYESCLGSCKGDPSCRSGCTIDHRVGTASDVSALSACLAAKCETECGLACGGFAPYVVPPDAGATCQACVESDPTACAAGRACGASEACDAFWRCYLTCPSYECQVNCRLSEEAGAALFDPFVLRYKNSCATPCAQGDYWSCVGHRTFPLLRSPTVKLTLTLAESPAGNGGAGVDVAVCTDCPCVGGDAGGNVLLGEGTTDDVGTVTLMHGNPANMGMGLNGCWQLTAPNIITEFVYWGFPLAGPTVVDTPGSNTPPSLVGGESVFGPAFYQSVASFGAPPDPTRGIVLFSALDCLSHPAPGVQIALTGSGIDSKVTEFYLNGGVGDTEATQTSADAFGGFLYVLPGRYKLTATPAGGAPPSSKVNVNVQAGVITRAWLFPNQ
jgi:hypothetical protein